MNVGDSYLGCGEILVKSGKTFVEESVRPPFTGDQVTEPHVGDFVRNYVLDALFVRIGRLLWIVEQSGFSAMRG